MKFAYLLNFFMILYCIHVVTGISFATKYKKYKRNNLNSRYLRVDTLGSGFRGLNNIYQNFTGNFSIVDGTTPQKSKEFIKYPLTMYPLLGLYSLQMEIGGQTFFMCIDTWATTFWVEGNKCVGEFCRYPAFDPSNATSFYDSGKSFGDKFYTVSGEIVASDINIAGAKAKNVFFNLINTELSPFLPGSGLIGMGHNPSQGYPISNSTPNPILALYQQKTIKNQLYSLYLGKMPNWKSGNGTFEKSILTLGGIDTTLYTGDINYISVKDKDNWIINLDDVIVNGKQLGIKGRQIILDTGFQNIHMPKEDSIAINTMIPDAKPLQDDYMLPCNTATNVSFVIGGVEYLIYSEDLANGYWGPPELPPDGWCMSSIYGYTDTGTPWHFGATFFHTIYAVFDYENSRVGLAQAAPRKN